MLASFSHGASRPRLMRSAASIVLLLAAGAAGRAGASPWLDVGDVALRSDIELLAAYHVIDGLTMVWPMPRAQLEAGLNDTARLRAAPADVQAAAERVRQALRINSDANGLRPLADLRGTNRAEVVRSFATTARDDVDVRGGGEWNGEHASVRLLAGTQTGISGDRGRFSLDGSAASASFGNALFYGGWMDRWFGPGWTSALSLSNNARPFPKIGVMRANPHAFETPWLSWLGPWQIDFFVGDLDGGRVDRNTLFGNLRLDFSPVRGLEIGLSRLTEFCGEHHPCNPVNAAFHFGNSDGNQNEVNEEATIDLKYTTRVATLSVTPYVQFMNEDTGPFTHSYTSYLAGTSLTGPWGDIGARWRLTGEYTDTLATLNWFDFGKHVYGGAYNNNAGYVDGFRYRDRTLGFSLDSDSRLISVSAQFLPVNGWRWRASYYHGTIGSGVLDNAHAAGSHDLNVVSARPVTLDEAEVGLDISWRSWMFNLAARAADAQPYPRGGSFLAGEVGVHYGF